MATATRRRDRNQPADDDYPGRQISDEDRSPLGLGWEYRRRGWSQDLCPLTGKENRLLFAQGFHSYVCSNPRSNAAMLTKGVPLPVPGSFQKP